jgi:hypothetical protein
MKDKLRILFIAWSGPYPTNVGGRQRTNLLYRALSELGEVDFVSLHNPERYSADEVTIMRQEYGLIGMAPLTMPADFGFWRRLKPLAPRWVNRIAHNLNPARSFYARDERLIAKLGDALDYGKYDLIVGRYARSLAKVGLPKDGVPPIVLDVDDLDTDAYESRLKQEGQGFWCRMLLKRHVSKIQKAQRDLLSQLKHLWVANPDNLKHPDCSLATVLPNIPFTGSRSDRNQEPVAKDCNVVMTIASYQHQPNVEGVEQFLTGVWPRVLEQHPKAVFRIYGSNLSDELRDRWSRHGGVEVVGFVENVSDAYRECALAVCPVQSGAGTNIKVVEAGFQSRLCVVTESASRGFASDPALANCLPVGRSAYEFAELIVRYLVDRDANRAMTAQFGAAIELNYSYEGFSSLVREKVEQILK